MAVSIAVVLTLTGCSGGGSDDVKPGSDEVQSSIPLADDLDPDGEFIWGYTVEATSLDPHRGSSGFDQNWLFPVYDRLVYSSPEGELEPMLATEWSVSDDGKALTLKLREGVKFSNGEAFDANAVKFSLDRAAGDESTVKSEMHNVVDVQVIDPYTVQINLAGGAGALLGSLADRAGMIVAPQAAQEGTLGENPVGVGAYVVSEVKPGESVSYEKTPDYWDPDAQNAGKMTFRIMTDDQTRLNALQSGELNMALLRQNQVAPVLNMGMKVLSGESPTFYYFGMNTSIAPFDNPDVRKALNMAIDREAIGGGLLEGFCTPQLQPWPSISFAYSEDIGDGLDVVPHDVDEAKKMLADAGFPDGFSFDAAVTNITGYTAVAEAVQAQLKEIGVTMNLQVVPSAQSGQMFMTDMSVAGTVYGYSPSPDPQGVLDRLLLPTAAANPGQYADPVIVDLAKQAGDAIEPEERAAAYAKISEQMLEVTPAAVPICMQHRTEGVTEQVSGLNIYPSGARDYRGVGVSKA